MQYEITDRAALLFSQVFYETLADNIPVDAAVSEARKAISIGIDNSLEWGTPVLYMRSPDGNLFSISGTFPSYSDVPKSPSLANNAGTILSTGVSSNYVSTSLRSMPGNRAAHITFQNPLEEAVDLYWLDEQGGEVWKHTLEPGQDWSEQTYINHLWCAKNSLGKMLSEVLVTEDQQSIFIPPSLRSMDTSTLIFITFYNYSNSVIKFYWLDSAGNEQYSERPWIQLRPGESAAQRSFMSHPWRIKDDKGQILGEVVGLKNQQTVSVYSSSKKV